MVELILGVVLISLLFVMILPNAIIEHKQNKKQESLTEVTKRKRDARGRFTK